MVYCLQIDLGAPVASSDPFIHLDSFVSYAAGVESVGRDGLQELDDDDGAVYFEDEMPFEKVEFEGEWVWSTSAAIIAEPDEEMGDTEHWTTTRWRKHFDHDPVHQVKETHVNTSSGDFKSYNAALPYNAADKLTFFFEGDPDRTVELIEQHIAAIGKKRSQGFGRIRDVTVADAGGAVESSVYHDGKVLRSFPESFASRVVSGVPIQNRTVRPPYWHQANQTLAYQPFSELPRDVVAEAVGLEPVDTA